MKALKIALTNKQILIASLTVFLLFGAGYFGGNLLPIDAIADTTPGTCIPVSKGGTNCETLPASAGGTGVTSIANIRTNLASTTAANALTNDIGVTGVLPAANGGTGRTDGNVNGAFSLIDDSTYTSSANPLDFNAVKPPAGRVISYYFDYNNNGPASGAGWALMFRRTNSWCVQLVFIVANAGSNNNNSYMRSSSVYEGGCSTWSAWAKLNN